MIMKHKKLLDCFIGIIIFAFLAIFPVNVAFGQDQPSPSPVYIVQAGDSLWAISQRFGIDIDDLMMVNGITDAGQLNAEQQLIIPGLEGIEGTLTTHELPFGETLRSLSRRYQISEQMLARLNHLASPSELFVGFDLVVPENDRSAPGYDRITVSEGQSILEMAVLHDRHPWEITANNLLTSTVTILPGDVMLIEANTPGGPAALPEAITDVQVNPLPLLQGKAGEIQISAGAGFDLSGLIIDRQLNFFETVPGEYISLQGIHAMTEPGFYPLRIAGSSSGESEAQFDFSQNIYVAEVNYPYDRPLTVNPTTIDPAVTEPETAQWTSLTQPVTVGNLWSGVFGIPSPLPADYCIETNECWSSRFGNRRSYNGGPYTSFHTGLDIIGKVGTEIYAPASGTVVFADPLTVRGNATMIDHGWGVYTGYMHQSEILVEVGEQVEPGQLIGLVGATGRVEGPHLHWEVWVGGVQVDPLDWLQQVYP